MKNKYVCARLMLSAVTILNFTSCGQDPAFVEKSPEMAANGDAPSRSSDDQTSSPVVSKNPENEAPPSSDATAPGTSASASPKVTYIPPADYAPSTPKSNVLKEDGGDLVMPGIKSTKVGVNFEDLNDFDFNDSVLCFTGSFKVNNHTVTSYKKQTVNAAIYSNSACGHYIHIKIRDQSGTITQNLTYNDRVTTSSQLNFDVGSTLDVVMDSFANSGCVATVDMNSLNRVQVAANLCRR